MRVLVLQLARLGDIIQTWPTLRAIKRNCPEAEIDLVVRSKFKEAAIHCESADRVLEFDTQAILGSCFSEQEPDLVLQSSLDHLEEFLEGLHPHYDMVVNLSYSPVGSYLAYLLSEQASEIRGYSRFSDGYLSLPDEASSYFYSQVGPQRTNRLHLTDIFAATAGLVLEPSDFRYPDLIPADAPATSNHLVVHVGASQAEKNCSGKKWVQLIHAITKIFDGTVYLVGTGSEGLASLYSLPESVVDLCGQTNIKDLFQLVRSSRGLVACDSLLVQIANLCDIPTVNLSHRSVSFWETGPRIKGSRVLQFADSEKLQASEVACLVSEMLRGTYLFKNAYRISESFNHDSVVGNISPKVNFQWDLTKALYFQNAFPVIDDLRLYKAFSKIQELAELGIEQVCSIEKRQNLEMAAGILNYIDDLMASLASIEGRISPIVRWFHTEKLRIGPGEIQQITSQTKTLFETLNEVCHFYVLPEVKPSSAPLEAVDGNHSI